jgi:thiamine-monophosphate kinase
VRNEDEIFRALAGRFRAGGGLRVGTGDDAAVLRAPAGREWVVTTDFCVEGVHFLDFRQSRPGQRQPARAVGWKALARSLSDLAAMGATPHYALVALAVPRHTPSRWLDEFFDGLAALARREKIRVAGGDLTTTTQIVANVSVLGTVARGRAVLRSGARPGDALFTSGTLGLAGLGAALLRQGARRDYPAAVAHYLLPPSRIALGRALARRGATAMMDVSDGLSTDLARLCAASRVGARVYESLLPTARATSRRPDPFRGFRDPLEFALDWGEDYELLFALPKARARRLPRRLAGVKLTRIGEITRGRGVTIVGRDGRERPLRPRGWDPFRKAVNSD